MELRGHVFSEGVALLSNVIVAVGFHLTLAPERPCISTLTIRSTSAQDRLHDYYGISETGEDKAA